MTKTLATTMMLAFVGILMSSPNQASANWTIRIDNYSNPGTPISEWATSTSVRINLETDNWVDTGFNVSGLNTLSGSHDVFYSDSQNWTHINKITLTALGADMLGID